MELTYLRLIKRKKEKGIKKKEKKGKSKENKKEWRKQIVILKHKNKGT